MRLRLFEAIAPMECLYRAAGELAKHELSDRVRPDRVVVLQTNVRPTRGAFFVDLFEAGADDPVFTVRVETGLVEAYAQIMDREGEHSVGEGLLRLTALLLPRGERVDWLEEQRGYLADLPTRRACWGWIFAQLLAMPRYAYTVRTGRERESA
ncbi:hypothetical protein AB0C98_28970 [Streptomyces sp. NPDC048558]|uniref:hypothetical protein n=1 Tax=Streptomyces sp. NPDC048558 TaxID=3155759 RepID=UPI00342C479F